MGSVRLILLAASVTIIACIDARSPVRAQSYPEKTVRLLVPFAAGGPGDTLARLVAQQLSLKLSQPVVVENQPGAGGLLAGVATATAEPNGYTLLMGTGS